MLEFYFFFFNDTATTEIYTLSLHDALPIYVANVRRGLLLVEFVNPTLIQRFRHAGTDRKSTRLNSSHLVISYAVFCLKKKRRCQRGRSPPPSQRNRCARLRHPTSRQWD